MKYLIFPRIPFSIILNLLTCYLFHLLHLILFLLFYLSPFFCYFLSARGLETTAFRLLVQKHPLFIAQSHKKYDIFKLVKVVTLCYYDHYSLVSISRSDHHDIPFALCPTIVFFSHILFSSENVILIPCNYELSDDHTTLLI